MGKYIHLFKNTNDFNIGCFTEKYVDPWISYTEQNDEVRFNHFTDTEEVATLRQIPLTFKALESGYVSIYYNDNSAEYEYRINNGSWKTRPVAPQTYYTSYEQYRINVEEGDIIQFRTDSIWGKGTSYQAYFRSTFKFDVFGNIMSILDKTSYDENYDSNTQLPKYAFKYIFNGCGIVNARYLLLPKKIGEYCYESAFRGCNSLITIPKLRTEELESYCYYEMFYNCTSLTKLPEDFVLHAGFFSCNGMFHNCSSLVSVPKNMLPDTTLKDACYQEMFYGCSSLTNAPDLPATTAKTQCYYGMFYGCSSLQEPPEVKLTTLSKSCCYNMFYNCRSLTTAPVLSALTLASSCYNYMFYGCSNLNYIKALFTTTPGTNYTSYWVKNVAANGTFVKHTNASWTTGGQHGAPSGWTIERASS